MATINMDLSKSRKAVEIEVNNVYSKIIGELQPYVFEKLDTALSYYVDGFQFSAAYKRGFWDKETSSYKHWDGKKHLLYSGVGFNSGLLFRVVELLSSVGVDVTVIDKRKVIPFGKEIKTKNFEARDYQQKALDVAIEKKSGIVKIATGGGKTVVISNLIAKINVKTLVVVPSIDLLYQTKEAIEKITGKSIGIVGDGEVDIKPITISTIWSAANALSKKMIKFDEEEFGRKEKFQTKDKKKIAKAVQDAEMLIIDEAHQAACSCIGVINSAAKNCYYKFGFSGTPQRFSGEDLLIEGIFGRKIVDVPASQLIDGGFLVKPIIHFINVPEKDDLSSENYQTIYKEYVVENEVRNAKIISAADKLIEAERSVLILVRNIKHGQVLLEELEKRYSVYFVKGDVDSDERNWVRKEFQKGKIDIIIATQLFDQGIDIPNLSALILAGSGRAAGRALQRIGRVIRPYPGKKDAIVVDFWDNCKYLTKHTEERIRIYRTEDGFKIKLPEKKDDDTSSACTKKAKKKKSKQLPTSKPGDPLPW
jgi:superfamily II DNA or RNA helicase